jgi:multidrug efflux pump subunit AcrA (membrane-fusion protein)
MKKKFLGVIFILILILVIGSYQIFIKKKEPAFTLAKVERGVVFEQISESGKVVRGEEINLGFETSGTIEEIYIKVGDKVEKGGKLAKLDTTQLFIQFQKAEANLEIAKAKLNKLLEGAREEEIEVYKRKTEKAKIALEKAKQRLEDVKTLSQEKLNQVYEDALDNAFLKGKGVLTTFTFLQKTYFNINDHPSLRIKKKIL